MTAARTIVCANRKGGCGKTTLAVNLAAWLSAHGAVLLVDTDPQGHAGLCLGVRGEETREGLAQELRHFLDEGRREVRSRRVGAVDLLAADDALSPFDGDGPGGEGLLRDYLAGCLGRYRYIVVDAPPAAGRLSRMALIAGDALVVPVRTDFLSLAGVAQMMGSFYRISATVNPLLRLAGVVPTMADLRTRMARDVVAELKRNFGPEAVFPSLRLDVKFSEAASRGCPIGAYAPRSHGAEDIGAIGAALLRRLGP